MCKMQIFQTSSALTVFLHSSAYYLDVEAESFSIPGTQHYSHAFYITSKTSSRWLKEVKT